MNAPGPSMGIQHVFVLMLENRSFDHLLGFSGITGTDAVSGQPTQIDGLNGTESNTFDGAAFPVTSPADYTMPADPLHEFPNVLVQLCGPGATYPSGGAYPKIDNSGFAASYMASGGTSPAEVMKCYAPAQLPVLNALAREFALCDNWHASMPGPTWPNRLFIHGASSGGLDHSPTTAEIVLWETLSGFSFKNGTIFDAMNKKKTSWRIYAGDDFPMAAALKGIWPLDIRPYSLFLQDIAKGSYPVSYTFVEPSYNVLSDYKCSTSQHPLDDVTRGEALIKSMYEAIRKSAVWENSLIIITWDEHGGFYDHVVPPATVAPGDTAPDSAHNKFGFTFERLGPRIPAVVISPRIPRNVIDHRVYDHASALATVETIFGLKPLTQRDAKANNLTPLLTLTAPRDDTPETLPDPADSGVGGCPPLPFGGQALSVEQPEPPDVTRGDDPVNDGNLPGVLQAALRQDLAVSPPEDRESIFGWVSGITTRAEAQEYVDAVRQKILAANRPGQ